MAISQFIHRYLSRIHGQFRTRVDSNDIRINHKRTTEMENQTSTFGSDASNIRALPIEPTNSSSTTTGTISGPTALTPDMSAPAKKSRASHRRQLLDIIHSKLLVIGHKQTVCRQVELCNVMLELVRHADREIRRDLANRIAKLDWISIDLVLYLANDEIDVSHRILLESPRLTDDDLGQIVRTTTFEHRLAIANRSGIGSTVSDILAAVAEPEVMTNLLRNASATISEATFNYLISECDRLENCNALLLARDDLPSHAQRVLLRKLAIHLDDQVYENLGQESELLKSVVESLASKPDQETKLSPVALIADALESQPRLAMGLLQSGETEVFYQLISCMTNLPLDSVSDAVTQGDLRDMAGLFRRAGFPLSAFYSLVQILHTALGTEHKMPSPDMVRAHFCQPISNTQDN